MKYLIILALVITTNAFSMNVSTSESKNKNSSIDRAISDKYGTESRESDTERSSYTSAVENSKSNQRAIVSLEQTDIFEKFEYLEQTNANDGFWKRCSIVSNPKLPVDFNITAEDVDYGIIDTNLATLIEQSAKSNSYITKIVDDSDEKEIREYINCLLKYSVVAAQSLVNGKFTTNITDKKLLRLNKSATNNLKKTIRKCRFAGSSNSIQCSSLKVILDYEPTLLDKQIYYFSKDKFMNLSGTSTYTVSDNQSIRAEEGTSSESTESDYIGQDNSNSRKGSSTKAVDTKSEISASSFFSKLF